MTTPFDATLTYSGSDPMDFIVIINPKNVSPKQGTIYQDLLPVAWQVLEFPANGGQIPFSYVPSYTALVMPYIVDNKITSKEGQTIGVNNVFDVTKSGDAYLISPDPSKKSKAIAAIVNNADTILHVGVGDKDKTAYMTLDVKPGWEREFLLFTEFAVIPVNGYVENQQFISDQVGPWLWIDGKAIGATLTIQHDGNNFTVTDLDKKSWKQNGVDVSPFA